MQNLTPVSWQYAFEGRESYPRTITAVSHYLVLNVTTGGHGYDSHQQQS
jgi:hypothetical protein